MASPSGIRRDHKRKDYLAENIAAVAESAHEDRGESIRHRAQQLGLTYGTTLRRDLKLKAYKIQLVQ